jgi:hypothetical protein
MAPVKDYFSCDAMDGYEFEALYDFESELPDTFYTNNDVCSRCTTLVANANALVAELGAGAPEVDEARAEADECDEECEAVQKISVYTKPVPSEELPEEHCGSTRALHIVSGPFYDWGGTAGENFPARDVSEYDGISFWAKKEPGDEFGRSLFVAITEKHTIDMEKADDAGNSNPDYVCGCTRGDDCDPEAEACDRFGVAVGISEQWRFFAIPFQRMRQRGYGVPAPYMDLEALLGFAVYYEAGTWDFWVDDVAFFKYADTNAED